MSSSGRAVNTLAAATRQQINPGQLGMALMMARHKLVA
jgi:hypothetical protein